MDAIGYSVFAIHIVNFSKNIEAKTSIAVHIYGTTSYAQVNR